jgi:hypothetical protein
MTSHNAPHAKNPGGVIFPPGLFFIRPMYYTKMLTNEMVFAIDLRLKEKSH